MINHIKLESSLFKNYENPNKYSKKIVFACCSLVFISLSLNIGLSIYNDIEIDNLFFIHITYICLLFAFCACFHHNKIIISAIESITSTLITILFSIYLINSVLIIVHILLTLVCYIMTATFIYDDYLESISDNKIKMVNIIP